MNKPRDPWNIEATLDSGFTDNRTDELLTSKANVSIKALGVKHEDIPVLIEAIPDLFNMIETLATCVDRITKNAIDDDPAIWVQSEMAVQRAKEMLK